MGNIFIKIREFMAGRNGVDKLSYGLVVIYCIFAAIKIFFRNSYIGYIIVSIIQYAILGYIIFRVLSKNVQARYKESVKFERYLSAWNPYFERLKLRITFFRTHRFRKCKHCGEFLRLKKSRGKREVTCPKCGKISKFYLIF